MRGRRARRMEEDRPAPIPFRYFCDRVCAHIRFAPDRPAVWEELLDHLEDRTEAILAAEPGLLLREAENRAVAAMGDPEELGRALDRVHNPLGGWLLRLLKLAAWLTALLALWGLLGGGLLALWINFTAPVPQNVYPSDLGTANGFSVNFANPFSGEPSGVQVQDPGEFPPSATMYGGDYTFSIERAVVDHYGDSTHLSYLLKVTHKNPWLRGPDFRDWLRAEDDLGNVYPSREEQDRSGLHIGDGDSSGNPVAIYPFVSYYAMWVSGIHPDATELTLIFDRYGTNEIFLTIPLTGGESGG